MALIDKINDGFIALTNLAKINKLALADNKVLLPQKIGKAQKWYQSGLRYGADYPNSYSPSSASASSGIQYFIPFTALEDATITALEVYCSTASSNATVSLGIYESDNNNDVANPLFTSSALGCSATGTKNAPCNVSITKGKVYWLSSMTIVGASFWRNATDSLKPIKGSASASSNPVIGFYTIGNTEMAKSAPTSKFDFSGSAPRVMFVVA